MNVEAKWQPVPGRSVGRGPFRPAVDGELERRQVLSHASHPAAVVHEMVQLSPPQNTLRSELNVTIGRTPGVKVGPLVEDGSTNEIDVTVKNRAHALALASVIQGDQQLGNIQVSVVVKTSKGQTISGITPTSVAQVVALEEAALDGNPYFKRVETRPVTPFSPDETVFPIFSASVVQFPNDNIYDYYNNTTMVAANAFSIVLNPAPGGIVVNPSTASL